mgnify:FL=1
MNAEDFESVIEHLPKNGTRLNLTGGEIFKNMNLLWNYLEIIQESNKGRGEENQIVQVLQTNGFWGNQSQNKIKEILKKLQKFEVKKLDITSEDRYHREEGLKTQYLENIGKANKLGKYVPTIGFRGAGETKNIFPAGRGQDILDKENFKYNMGSDCKGELNDGSPTIDPFGNLYMCCFNMYQLPGNIIYEPIEDIVKRAKGDRELRRLNSYGIRSVARLNGMEEKEIRSIAEKHGDCGLCAKLNDLI